MSSGNVGRRAIAGRGMLVVSGAIAALGCSEADMVDEAADSSAESIWNGTASPSNGTTNSAVKVQLVAPPFGQTLGLGCSSTMLTHEIVITAAHCTNDPGATSVAQIGIGPNPNSPELRRPVLGGVNCTVQSGPTSCFSTDPQGQWRTGSVRTMIGTAPWQNLPSQFPNDVALVRLAAPTTAMLAQCETMGTGCNFPAKPYLGALPASGTTDALMAGYGDVATGIGLNTPVQSAGSTPWPVRQQQVFNPFVYSTDPSHITATFGSAADFRHLGGAPGDSGGPLYMRVNGVLQQVGVASTACFPSFTTVVNPDNAMPILGPDLVAGTADDRQESCSPVQCATNQFWNGTNCVAIVAGSNNFTQGMRYSTSWMNLTSTAIRDWVVANVTDPSRPNRWIGERDYSGACRTDVDANCDRNLDLVASCPVIFDAGALGGSNPADLNREPKLAAFAGQTLRLNDRTRLIANDGSRATAANGGFSPSSASWVFSDTQVGKLVLDSATAFFAHRYTVDSILARSTTAFTVQDGRNLAPITTFGARSPRIIYTATFPPAPNGPDLILEPGQQFPTDPAAVLSPGRYLRNVTLKRDSVLRLTGGEYYFDNFDVQAGGRIIFNRILTPTIIHVRNFMRWDGSTQTIAGDQFATLVAVHADNATVFFNQAFTGTVVVPRGNIVLASRTYFGAFYAGRDLSLHQDGRINHRPLVCP